MFIADSPLTSQSTSDTMVAMKILSYHPVKSPFPLYTYKILLHSAVFFISHRFIIPFDAIFRL